LRPNEKVSMFVLSYGKNDNQTIEQKTHHV